MKFDFIGLKKKLFFAINVFQNHRSQNFIVLQTFGLKKVMKILQTDEINKLYFLQIRLWPKTKFFGSRSFIYKSPSFTEISIYVF